MALGRYYEGVALLYGLSGRCSSCHGLSGHVNSGVSGRYVAKPYARRPDPR